MWVFTTRIGLRWPSSGAVAWPLLSLVVTDRRVRVRGLWWTGTASVDEVNEVRLVRTLLGPCVWLFGRSPLSRVLLVRPAGVTDIVAALAREGFAISPSLWSYEAFRVNRR